MATQCKEIVYVRDQYRYSGRGRGRFSMHYARRECSRMTTHESGYCYQHRPSQEALAARHDAERSG